jgi:hypothetical protein
MTVRKYKSGGAVPRDGGGRAVEMPDVEPDVIASESPPEPAAAVVQPSPVIDRGPVAEALAAVQRAEELQAQYAQKPPTLGEAIDNDPHLSRPQKQFLKQNPHVLNDQRALLFYVGQARSRGITDDTPAFFQHILNGFQREYERGVENARHLAEMAAQPHRAADKGREQAEEIIEHAQAMLPDVPLPGAETSPAPPARPSPASPRRSVPVSAPVHRDVPTFGGNREAYVDTKLTAEERDIARRSFTAPDMTNEQKEYLYWVNREKLRKMRRDGTYRQTTEQTG